MVFKGSRLLVCFIQLFLVSSFNQVNFNNALQQAFKVNNKIDKSTDKATPKQPVKQQQYLDRSSIPSNGLTDYIGNTKIELIDGQRWTQNDNPINYQPITDNQLFLTRFNLFRQLPWKKIGGKFVLKAIIGGDFPFESTPPGFSFGAQKDLDLVDTLSDLNNMFLFGANDPRVQGIFLEIAPVACGYAKLTELKRSMDYFRQSGKKIFGFSEQASEKELYVSLSCDEYYIPPDGGLDLRGFSGSATFVRGVFEKLGIEPQVQRIGKYKSFGDTFNRTEISSAQREVISSLIIEASDYWADEVANSLNKSVDEITSVWKDAGIKSPYDYAKLGLISGVRYYDQVEELVQFTYRKDQNKTASFIQNVATWWRSITDQNVSRTLLTFDDMMKAEMKSVNSDFDLTTEFDLYARRTYTPTSKVISTTTPSTTSSSAVTTTNDNNNNIDTTSGSGILPVVTAVEMTASASATIMVSESEKAKQMAEKIKAIYKLKKQRSLARFYPAGLYLRKMRKGHRILQGVPLREVMSGPRIAIINAVGGIASGKSGNGAMGKSLGSETLVEAVRRARFDPGIRGVVLRIDSPGGSALASDVMWREIRLLAREKPVVASQVDVAASGGYYLSMACDQIVAEDLTITGSIGVVTAKFNLKELNKKIGYNVETVSRGRYAEVLSTSRSFTPAEEKYFEDGAKKAYESFTAKAAASRNMTVPAMLEVAQGRVWTGRQALKRGLVDHIGGVWKAVEIAADLSDLRKKPTAAGSRSNSSGNKNVTLSALSEIRVQTIKAPRTGFGLPFGVGASMSGSGNSGNIITDSITSILSMGMGMNNGFDSSRYTSSSPSNNNDMNDRRDVEGPLYLCDDVVATTGLASAESLGMSPVLQSLGCGPLVSFLITHSPESRSLLTTLTQSSAGVSGMNGNPMNAITNLIDNILQSMQE